MNAITVRPYRHDPTCPDTAVTGNVARRRGGRKRQICGLLSLTHPVCSVSDS